MSVLRSVLCVRLDGAISRERGTWNLGRRDVITNTAAP